MGEGMLTWGGRNSDIEGSCENTGVFTYREQVGRFDGCYLPIDENPNWSPTSEWYHIQHIQTLRLINTPSFGLARRSCFH